MPFRHGATGVAQRRDFVIAARIGSATGYTPIGTRVPDATLELNQDIETEVDIFEQSWSTVGAAQPTMDFEGVVNGQEYDIHSLMLEAFLDGDTNRVQGIDCILIFGYDGTGTTYTAGRRSSCTLQFNSLGGAGEAARTNQSFTIHFGGERSRGTASSISPGAPITYTPTA